MLVTEYIASHDVYIVTPVHADKSLGQEFIFADAYEQECFVYAFFRNPMAAVFAYNTMRELDKEVFHG